MDYVMSLPLFSIIIPCYNQAQYLSEAVYSVLAQSISNWECIIVDDGSSDDTEDVALFLCTLDNRIRYYKKDNEGVAAARNYGIQRASGDWILPLDGDDKISEFYLEYSQKEILKRSNLDVIYCRAFFFGDLSGEWFLPQFDFYKMLVENQIFCSAIFKKSDWLRIGGYDTNMTYGFEDWEFWINLLKSGNKEVIKLNYLGFSYRKKNISRTTEVMSFQHHIQSMHRYIYNKHCDVYSEYFGSFQYLAQDYLKLKEENSFFYKSINKNYFSKILFKIIRFF